MRHTMPARLWTIGYKLAESSRGNRANQRALTGVRVLNLPESRGVKRLRRSALFPAGVFRAAREWMETIGLVMFILGTSIFRSP